MKVKKNVIKKNANKSVFLNSDPSFLLMITINDYIDDFKRLF